MEKWVEDIQMAIDLAEKSSGPTPEFLASSPPDNSKCWVGRILPGAAQARHLQESAVAGRDSSGLRREDSPWHVKVTLPGTPHICG